MRQSRGIPRSTTIHGAVNDLFLHAGPVSVLCVRLQKCLMRTVRILTQQALFSRLILPVFSHFRNMDIALLSTPLFFPPSSFLFYSLVLCQLLRDIRDITRVWAVGRADILVQFSLRKMFYNFLAFSFSTFALFSNLYPS